jgi:hypothetical protein
MAKIKYKTPISLAFEDKNHLSNHILIEEILKFKFKFSDATLLFNKTFLFRNKFFIFKKEI